MSSRRRDSAGARDVGGRPDAVGRTVKPSCSSWWGSELTVRQAVRRHGRLEPAVAAHRPMRTPARQGYSAAMSTTAIILSAVKTSLALTVLGLGLRSQPGDATYLLRHRGL